MGRKRTRHLWAALAAFLLLALLACAGLYSSVSIWPSVGAQGADLLRKVAGDEFVARLEGLVLGFQDQLHRWQYRGGAEPDVPWAVAPAATPTPVSATPTPLPTPAESLLGFNPKASDTPLPSSAEPQEPTPTPALTPAWGPSALPATGSMPGEGQWSPYISSPSGQVVAYRTFLQPDPERSYALAAVIAFDLSAVRLNYVLGIDEPSADVQVSRLGTIPPEDMQPGRLLAVFNGGFKGRHGHFGVMVDQTVVIPPRDGLGTVAIYKDGSVRIGTWGQDIQESPDILAWRQNGPLIIQKGQVNPSVNNNSVEDWGSTVDGAGVVATWRSSLGISADGKTLYYVAGPNLTMPALAAALKAAGVSEAVQLDINNYWVLFGAVEWQDGKPNTLPLFKEWNDNINRYLYPCTRDFFYITVK